MNIVGTDKTLIDLDTALAAFAGRDTLYAAAAEAIRSIAASAVDLEALIAAGALAGTLAEEVGDHHDGDKRCALDGIAGRMLVKALSTTPVSVIGWKGKHKPTSLYQDAPIAVALDPLNGSSHIDVNIPVGTIFSILPAVSDEAEAAPERALLQPGHRQIAAGFIIFGPQTCLVLTLGEGTDLFTLDRRDGVFVRTRTDIRIATDSDDYAIDASKYRHWDKPIQAYVDDNVAGIDGPGGKSFSMRWTASLVAEAYRILNRGGIFLYPGDRRQGWKKGRLRLVFEANPLAMIVEQAGGLATNGEDRLLDIRPRQLDQRAPVVFGSSRNVARVTSFHDGTLALGERSPLFGHRGLFRH